MHHLVSSTSDQLMVSTPLAISSVCPKFLEHGNLVLCSKYNSFKTGFNIKCEPWGRMHICAYCPAGFNIPPPTFAVHTSTHHNLYHCIYTLLHRVYLTHPPTYLRKFAPGTRIDNVKFDSHSKLAFHSFSSYLSFNIPILFCVFKSTI